MATLHMWRLTRVAGGCSHGRPARWPRPCSGGHGSVAKDVLGSCLPISTAGPWCVRESRRSTALTNEGRIPDERWPEPGQGRPVGPSLPSIRPPLPPLRTLSYNSPIKRPCPFVLLIDQGKGMGVAPWDRCTWRTERGHCRRGIIVIPPTTWPVWLQ